MNWDNNILLNTKVVQPFQIWEKKNKLSSLLLQLEERRKKYAILDSNMERILKQKELFGDMIARLAKPINARFRFYLYYGGNGAGKCWAPNEPMLMFDGTWKNAGDLVVWDLLMWVDSTPRSVTSTYRGNSSLYRITPESWEPIVVNWNHQLMLTHRRRNRKWNRCELQKEYSHLENFVPEWKLVQIWVEDYIDKSDKWKAEAYMWRPKIVNFDRKIQSIDPYFLWLWLWDWSTWAPAITNIDSEVADYMYDYAEKLWLDIIKRWITYYFRKKYISRYWFSWYSLLREVIWNKHIPINYKTWDEYQRLQLLAWLIDTDWEFSWNHKTPRYSITQKNKQLAYDILDIARWLWFRCSIKEEIKVCTNATREDYVPWKYFRVSINWDVWRIPCKIKRKIAIAKDRKDNKDWLVTKFDVESIWVWEYVWFTLDWDKLHLDRNFVVHHNTHSGAYITVLLALGTNTSKYWLPYLGTKKNIWICTKSGSNVKSTIMPYLLWEFSKTRIPPDEIEWVPKLDNGILKSIKLKNGCEIHIKTYDQGQENVQGGNPDWMWLDEEPTNSEVWGELKARTRTANCEMLITMTPLNGLTWVYDFFFNSENEELTSKCKIYRVSSLDNPYTDKTWTLWMTDEEYRLRVDGSFENPTWLVYSSFSRSKNVVPHFNPRDLWEWVKYYRWIDFGTSHPTWVTFLAVDNDDNVYIYDEIRLANTELKEIVRNINEKSKWTDFEYFVRDSAAAREWLELESQFWIYTTRADKRSKGANDMSNRRTWILMLNTLFKEGKLMISDKCPMTIKEFETHYYKDWSRRDWEVNKIDDDLIDAIRYTIFLIKKSHWPKKPKWNLRNIPKKNPVFKGIRML